MVGTMFAILDDGNISQTINKTYDMEKGKIYLVCLEEVFDYEDFQPRHAAFRKEEDAKKCLQEWKSEALREYKVEEGEEEWVQDGNGETFWSLYISGEYTNTHINIRLTRLAIE